MGDNMNQIPPETVEEIKKIGQLALGFVECTFEAFRKTAEQIGRLLTKSANHFVDYMLYAANDNPKWWHLYKHAKKRRTRKKYRNRLMRQLLGIQRTVSAQEA